MDENQLERNLKGSMKDLIKFLGNQGTEEAEFTVAKIALEYRMQRRLLWPTWLLAIATIVALMITVFQTWRIEQQVNMLDKNLQNLQNVHN